MDSTLQYTMPNILSQVQDLPLPSPASQPVDHQESVIPVLLTPAVNPQIDNQHPVPPVDDSKFRRSVNNPYANPLVL